LSDDFGIQKHFTEHISQSFAISLSQVFSFLIQKYFLENSNILSAFIMFIFIVLIFGALVFVLVLAFAPFRKFLLKMYGVFNQN